MTTNQDQIEYWNSEAGPRWADGATAMDARLRPLAQHAMDALELQDGERVLDVGCGCGDTTLLLAKNVGSHGEAVGVDISAPMLHIAQQRSSANSNVSFTRQDAQQWQPDECFDAVFSRFGVMFFEDPVAAFTNLRRLSRPRGRIGFVCWRDKELNPWMTAPVRSVAHLLELPDPPAPRDPGPFAFGESEYLLSILDDAGWTQAKLTPIDTRLDLGTPEEAAQFFTQIGPLTAPVADLEEKQRKVVEDALLRWMRESAESGTVQLPASVWSVEAHQP